MANETVFHLRIRRSRPPERPPAPVRVRFQPRPFSDDPPDVTTTVGFRSQFVVTNGPLASGRYRR